MDLTPTIVRRGRDFMSALDYLEVVIPMPYKLPPFQPHPREFTSGKLLAAISLSSHSILLLLSRVSI
jgi:hypothetical protein